MTELSLIRDSISGDIYVTDGQYISDSLPQSVSDDLSSGALGLWEVEVNQERGEGWDDARYVTLRREG